MTVGLWLPRPVFWAIILSATLTTRTEAVGDFVDTATCYDGLAQADVNGDNRVERDEYLTFVQLIGPPGFLADIDSMLNAPLTLQGSFLTLACNCDQNGGDAQCCIGDNAHIPIDGVKNPDPFTFSFLFSVCTLTSRSINIVLEELSPISTSPLTSTISLAPTPMSSNSAVPTATVTPTTTEEPTQSPSSSPSAIPASHRPTTSPSSSPPSSSPSAIPTTSPRPMPTTSPSSTQPSSMPTGEGIGIVLVKTIYTVVIVHGITENFPKSSYVPDLIASMNVVAVEVASEVYFFGASSNDSSRRRLEVRVSLPTFIDGVVDAVGGLADMADNIFELGACPSNLANLDNYKCEQVTASVGLILDDEAPQVARQVYQTALHRAIAEGRLQDALVEINPDSPARIITGKSSGTNGVNSSRSTESENLSAYATVVWIVIGALAVVGLMVAIFIVRKGEEKPAFDERQLLSTIPSGSSIEGWSNARDSQELNMQTLSEGGGDQGPRGSNPDSISSAGQSDGPFMSTSSLDSCDEEFADELHPTNCGTIMVDLDNAIIAGDQATIVATTALLAVNASGRWDCESNVSSRESSASGAVLLDEPKDAELHRLVDGGDWEGLIRAAKTLSSDAKSLDGSILSHPGSRGSASGVESSHPSSTSSYIEGSATGSTTGSGISPHTFPSSTLATGTSKTRNRAKRCDWPSMLTSSLDDSGDESADELDPTNCWGTLMVDLYTGSTELDNAIAAEDRAVDQATVGAATALLAANASGRWDCKSSVSSRQSAASSAVLLDEPNAAELHPLIDGGDDLEGVIRAAPTLPSDDKSLAESILSHQDSRGSASGVESLTLEMAMSPRSGVAEVSSLGT